MTESLPHLTPEQVQALVSRCSELTAERDAERRRADAIGRELVAVREMLDAMRADYVALLKAQPARLDADRTAKPRTILTAPVVAGHEGTCCAGPATAIVDTDTGERVSLHEESNR